MLRLFENRKLDVNAKELFESSLGLVEQVIAFICRRHRLYDARAEDFASYARLALIDSDYAILRKFQGRSSLGTYLTTVIHRLYLDYLNREHGNGALPRRRKSWARQRFGWKHLYRETVVPSKRPSSS